MGKHETSGSDIEKALANKLKDDKKTSRLLADLLSTLDSLEFMFEHDQEYVLFASNGDISADFYTRDGGVNQLGNRLQQIYDID